MEPMSPRWTWGRARHRNEGEGKDPEPSLPFLWPTPPCISREASYTANFQIHQLTAARLPWHRSGLIVSLWRGCGGRGRDQAGERGGDGSFAGTITVVVPLVSDQDTLPSKGGSPCAACISYLGVACSTCRFQGSTSVLPSENH